MKKDIPGTFDDLARRNAGTSPASYEEAARRRAEAAATSIREEPFNAEPAEITRRALQIAEVRSGLGVPAVDAERLAEVSGGVDDNAGFVAPILCGVLREVPRVAAGSRVDPERLRALDAQRGEMGDLRITATQLRRDVTDTRRVASADVRAKCRAIVEHVQSQLATGRLPRAEQDLLRSDAGEVLALWEALTQGPVLERDKTLAADRAHEEKLVAEKDEQLMARTMLALRGGEEVDQEAWDHAAEVYDALSARSEAQNRRGRSR